jgi:outer membrane immunogenic protein
MTIKKIALVAVATIGLSSAALAADMRMPAKAPPPVVSPAINWSGFYIGVMGGYGVSDEISVAIPGVAGVTVSSSDLSGGFVGGTIGYNYQAAGSPFVLGLEVDAAWANIKVTRSAAALGVVATLEDRIDALGSVTGRLGYAWGPGLLYVKGGWAWANNEVTATLATPAVVVSASESHFHSGWTIGGGLEYLFAPNWSGKIEYMYADYGSATYGGGLIAGGFGLSATVHTIKGGINYHFDWGGSPVVARY